MSRMTIRIAKVGAELETRAGLEEGADRRVADGLHILARIIARAYLESRKSDHRGREYQTREGVEMKDQIKEASPVDEIASQDEV